MSMRKRRYRRYWVPINPWHISNYRVTISTCVISQFGFGVDESAGKIIGEINFDKR